MGSGVVAAKPDPLNGFVRRDSSEPLYRKVLALYVHMAVAGGLTQAVFPGGRLTRDGGLQQAKLGLIGYMVSGFDAKGARDVVFVPVGINYDAGGVRALISAGVPL